MTMVLYDHPLSPYAREERSSPSAQTGTGMADVADLVARGLFEREHRDHRLEWMIKSGGLHVVAKGLARDNIRFAPEFG